MSSLRFSGQYCAVIDQRERTISIRSRITEWNLVMLEDPDQEDLDQAIEKMDLDEFIEKGYKLTRE